MFYTNIVHTVVYCIRLPALVGGEIAAQDKKWGRCSHLKSSIYFAPLLLILSFEVVRNAYP